MSFIIQKWASESKKEFALFQWSSAGLDLPTV